MGPVLRAFPPVLVALGLLAGCAPRLAGTGEPRVVDFTVGPARFRILHAPEEERSARRVRRAIETAAARVERWGGLRHPITVTLHPTRAALEEAVLRPGYGVRAWARYETIDLQSPRTWGLLGASDRQLEELLTHELTHCAMYQRAGDHVSWMYKGIPRWFAEGIASVTAGQGHRHGSVHDLFGGDEDPLADPDPARPSQPDAVYAAAHHAAEFLLSRYGEARVVEVLRLMGGGLPFPAAFEQAIGISAEELTADFRRYVLWQGWRR